MEAGPTKRRWIQLTRLRGLLGFLAVECFLLVSYRLSWFDFDEHKERPFLIVLGCAGAVIVWSVTSSVRTRTLSLIRMIAARLSRRRTYQFSIRTLLVGVTLLCVAAGIAGWLHKQMLIVQERHQMTSSWLCRITGIVHRPESRFRPSNGIPWYRLLLGDFEYSEIFLDRSATDADVERYRAAFSEAEIIHE